MGKEQCNQEIRRKNPEAAYPRTCRECGFGPCKHEGRVVPQDLRLKPEVEEDLRNLTALCLTLETLAKHLKFAYAGYTVDYADRTEEDYVTRLFHEAKLEVLREIVEELKTAEGGVGRIIQACLRENLGDLYDD